MLEAILTCVKFTPLGDRVLVKKIEPEEARKSGIIIPETAKEKPHQGEVVEGMQFDRGYISPYFVTDAEKMECVLVDGAVAAAKTREAQSFGYGYNAVTGRFEDLRTSGIWDPTKVARVSLQNAASVSSLLLTTEIPVAEAPENKEDESPSVPPLSEEY